jgi:Mg-chelatase subunit ChlD
MKESDFDFLKQNLEQFPELKEAFFNPIKIDSTGDIAKMNKSMTLPVMICDNPDTELPKVPLQLNFIVPSAMRKSKEIYIINIKNDIIMYKKLYEKNSSLVNKIIDETKQCLKNLYKPLKSLRDDVKSYSNNFENSLNQLTIPLKNGKSGLDEIDYKKYPKEKQNKFLKDKDEVIKEIDNFLLEANEFYKVYGKLNKATSDDINKFVEQFNKLVVPAKEMISFMRGLMKAFEKSSHSFNDFKNKKKIDEALQAIRKPINDFYNKIKNLENLLDSIKNIKIERINEMQDISNKIKEKISKLEESSKKISEKIKIIRDKYEEPEEQLIEVNMDPAQPVNIDDVGKQLGEEGKIFGNKAEKSMSILKDDIIKANMQARLDLLFIMDITNSMDYYLDQVKEDILKMIETIQKECGGVIIYLGFVGYRDFNDLDLGEEYINLEFTTDYESIRSNIEYVTAHGGGDIPEDLLGGLELGINKDWKGKTRFSIIVTDSPCHGKKYHDLTGDNEDNYPDGDREDPDNPTKRNIEEYIKQFAQKDISLFCLKINDTTDKMFKIFEGVYNKNKNENSTNKFVLGEGKKLFDIVTKNAINLFQNRGMA